MRLCAYKLSQPTVFACLFLLLSVMNLEQVRCTKRTLVLYHDSSKSYLTMYRNGTVGTVPMFEDNYTPNQCLEMDSISSSHENITLSIYNHATKRFLCFKRNGKLIAARKCSELCQFRELTPAANGYLSYEVSVNNETFYLAFTRNGKPSKKVSHMLKRQALFLTKQSDKCVQHWNETTIRKKRHQKCSSKRHSDV